MFVTSVMAGEKSGSLVEVLDRYISYQRIALAVRKKVIVSLMYPCVLIVLVVAADGLPGDLRGADFRARCTGRCRRSCRHDAVWLIAVGTAARSYIVFLRCRHRGAAIVLFRWWARRDAARIRIDRVKMRLPIVGRDLDQVSGGPAFAHPEHAADRAASRWSRRMETAADSLEYAAC